LGKVPEGSTLIFELLPGLWRDSLHVTCGLTACTLGSAPGPTLGNEYVKILPFLHTFMHAFIGALAKTFSDLLAIDFYCSLFLVYMKYITSTFVDVASTQTDLLYITKITYMLVSYYVSVCCSSALSVCVLFYLFCRFSSYVKFAAAIGEYVCSPLKQMMQTLLHPFCPFPVTS